MDLIGKENRNQFQLAKVFLCFYLLVCLTFLLLKTDTKVRAFRDFVFYLLSPTASSASTFLTHGTALGARLPQLIQAEQENNSLKDALAEAIRQRTVLEELQKELQFLRAYVSSYEQVSYRSVVARVLLRDPSFWRSGFLIDRGKKDGISVNLPVVVLSTKREMLLGRIVEVSDRHSKVLLITDSLSAVSVRLLRSSETGVMEGEGGGKLVMKYLFPEADVQVGDEIVTAGLGGAFPPGILVGRVAGVNPLVSGTFRSAKVKPAAPLGRLSEVIVLLKE